MKKQDNKSWEQDVGPGWRPIVRAAIHLLTQKGAVITQVKEKFGGLRLYYHPAEAKEPLEPIVEAAEILTSALCEECGEPGKLRNDLPWLKTLCDEHYEERKKQYG